MPPHMKLANIITRAGVVQSKVSPTICLAALEARGGTEPYSTEHLYV